MRREEALKTHVREGWEVLESYLAADCRALWQLLRWLRAGQAAPQVDPATAPYVGWDAVQQDLSRRAGAGLCRAERGQGGCRLRPAGAQQDDGQAAGESPAFGAMSWP